MSAQVRCRSSALVPQEVSLWQLLSPWPSSTPSSSCSGYERFLLDTLDTQATSIFRIATQSGTYVVKIQVQLQHLATVLVLMICWQLTIHFFNRGTTICCPPMLDRSYSMVWAYWPCSWMLIWKSVPFDSTCSAWSYQVHTNTFHFMEKSPNNIYLKILLK